MSSSIASLHLRPTSHIYGSIGAEGLAQNLTFSPFLFCCSFVAEMTAFASGVLIFQTIDLGHKIIFRSQNDAEVPSFLISPYVGFTAWNERVISASWLFAEFLQ